MAFGIIGRHRELAAINELLDQAAAGTGGLLVLSGPAGSGRTALAEAAADRAAQRGFEVIWLPAGAGEQGSVLWTQVRPEMRGDSAHPGAHGSSAADPGDQRRAGPAGAGSPLAAGGGLTAGDVSAATGSVAGGTADTRDGDALVAALADGVRRLVLVDDADQGAAAGIALIRGLAGRLAGSATAVLATTGAGLGGLTALPGLAGRTGLAESAGSAGLAGPPGLAVLAGLAGRGRVLALEPLSPDEIGELAGVTGEAARYALWAASGGRPGPAGPAITWRAGPGWPAWAAGTLRSICAAPPAGAGLSGPRMIRCSLGAPWGAGPSGPRTMRCEPGAAGAPCGPGPVKLATRLSQ